MLIIAVCMLIIVIRFNSEFLHVQFLTLVAQCTMR